MVISDRANGHRYGAGLRKLRERRRLSLAQLEQRSGVSASYISRIERGRNEPGLSVWQDLAHGLKVPLWYLLIWGSDEKYKSLTEVTPAQIWDAVRIVKTARAAS